MSEEVLNKSNGNVLLFIKARSPALAAKPHYLAGLVDTLSKKFLSEEKNLVVIVVPSNGEVFPTRAAIESLEERFTTCAIGPRTTATDRYGKYRYPAYNVLILSKSTYRKDAQAISSLIKANKTTVVCSKGFKHGAGEDIEVLLLPEKAEK